MSIRRLLSLAFLAAGCAPAADPPQDPVEGAAPGAVTSPDSAAALAELAATEDWANADPVKATIAFETGVRRALAPLSAPAASEALASAGYTCRDATPQEREQSLAQVCTREFATRACQMTWEVKAPADLSAADVIIADFQRDCVGTERDWPHAVASAIDDQLAPASPPN
jgi:hypothetical protein